MMTLLNSVLFAHISKNTYLHPRYITVLLPMKLVLHPSGITFGVDFIQESRTAIQSCTLSSLSSDLCDVDKYSFRVLCQK